MLDQLNKRKISLNARWLRRSTSSFTSGRFLLIESEARLEVTAKFSSDKLSRVVSVRRRRWHLEKGLE
jgi:hypothetical protein